MPLGYDFATLAEAKLRIGLDPAVDTSDDTDLSALLEEAGQEFVELTGGHYFGESKSVTWTLYGRGGTVRLPQAPSAIASVSTNSNGGGLTVLETLVADAYRAKGSLLIRSDGRLFPESPGYSVVVATIGYSAVPEDARGAVLSLFAHRYRSRTKASTLLEQAVDQAKARGRDSEPALPRSVAVAVRKYRGIVRGGF